MVTCAGAREPISAPGASFAVIAKLRRCGCHAFAAPTKVGLSASRSFEASDCLSARRNQSDDCVEPKGGHVSDGKCVP